MTRKQEIQRRLVDLGDEIERADRRYRELRDARDAAKRATAESMHEHRTVIQQVEQVVSDANRKRAESLDRHRAVKSVAEQAEWECQEAWKEYRHLSKSVQPLQIELITA